MNGRKLRLLGWQFGLVLFSALVAWWLEGLREPTVIVVQDREAEPTSLSSAPVIRRDYRAGESTEVCGVVAEVKAFKEGNYLNLGGKFPRQIITITLWQRGNFQDDVGRTVCAYGAVQEYRGRLSVNVQHHGQLRFYPSR